MSSSFEAVSRLTVWLRDHGADQTQVWRDDLAEVLRMAAMVLPTATVKIDEKHMRLCWTCMTVNEHESRITPGVLCPKCRSQDTRAIKAAN